MRFGANREAALVDGSGAGCLGLKEGEISIQWMQWGWPSFRHDAMIDEVNPGKYSHSVACSLSNQYIIIIIAYWVYALKTWISLSIPLVYSPHTVADPFEMAMKREREREIYIYIYKIR